MSAYAELGGALRHHSSPLFASRILSRSVLAPSRIFFSMSKKKIAKQRKEKNEIKQKNAELLSRWPPQHRKKKFKNSASRQWQWYKLMIFEEKNPRVIWNSCSAETRDFLISTRKLSEKKFINLQKLSLYLNKVWSRYIKSRLKLSPTTHVLVVSMQIANFINE